MHPEQRIIFRPVVTEAMTRITERQPRYGFIVDERANKIEIARAIEELYSVTVLSVNTMRYQGKRKARFTKKGQVIGRKDSFKKAIVTLKKGDTIDFYSNI